VPLLERPPRSDAADAGATLADAADTNETLSGEPRLPGSSRLTTALYTLAFLAVCNLVISCVRLATAVNHRPGELRLLAEIAVSVGSLWWAVRRTRSRGGLRPVSGRLGSLGPEARPTTLEPAGTPSRWWPWLRRARQVAVPALMVLGAISVAGQWGTVEAAVRQFVHLHWRWIRWAIYAEALSIVAYAWISRALLRASRRPISMGRLIAIGLGSNALATSVPGGPAWAATFTFDQFRRRGVTRGRAAVALCSTVVVSIASLTVLLVVGVDLAGSHGPAAAFRPLITAAAAALMVVFALFAVPSTRRRLVRVTARRAGPRSRRLGRAARSPLDAMGLPRVAVGHLAEGLAASLLSWLADCGCLVAAILAVSGHVPWTGILVIYGVTQIAENLPITPGGIGVVEGALSLMLVAYGMSTDTAVAAVLLYRIISFWLLVPLGWLAAGGLVLERRCERPRRVPAGGPGPAIVTPPLVAPRALP
jgi:putative heme transporter